MPFTFLYLYSNYILLLVSNIICYTFLIIIITIIILFYYYYYFFLYLLHFIQNLGHVDKIKNELLFLYFTYILMIICIFKVVL